jgi:hypothetical protein
MKTPEELAEEWASNRCPEQGPEFIVWNMCKDDFLAGYQAAASQWISVKDRLPEIGENGFSEDVLLQTQFGEMHVSCFENITREIRVEWGDAGFLSLDDFTHWMPLPAAPEEEK